jgi:dienelactone hydrolase
VRNILCSLLSVIIACACASAARAEAGTKCQAGIYRLADANLVDVAPEGAGLRWRTLDGRTGLITPLAGGGWKGSRGFTDDPDTTSLAFGACGGGRIVFAGVPGRAVSLKVIDTRFVSHGVGLKGRLVMPAGSGRVAVMVLGHGSERTGATATAFRQRLYPTAGVGVFLFDKRGTGDSGGTYTQDFSLLADDMAAAMDEARRLAGRRAGRIGFEGGSQAGWVLPLAASRTRADFVIIGYGIAASPAEEDRTETLQDLAAAGWGADVLAKGREVTDATTELVRSNFTRGFARFNAVVAAYRAEPWFKDLKGEYTGDIVRLGEAELRVEGPAHDVGTPWDYDAVGALRRLPAPLLWMIAGEDTEGAGPETPRALAALQGEGRPVTVAVFPATEHGMHTFFVRAGRREHTGYAPGYFAMELDFARRGRLPGSYGQASITPPRRGPAR